jgi:hypothetical protein
VIRAVLSAHCGIQQKEEKKKIYDEKEGGVSEG